MFFEEEVFVRCRICRLVRGCRVFWLMVFSWFLLRFSSVREDSFVRVWFFSSLMLFFCRWSFCSCWSKDSRLWGKRVLRLGVCFFFIKLDWVVFFNYFSFIGWGVIMEYFVFLDFRCLLVGVRRWNLVVVLVGCLLGRVCVVGLGLWRCCCVSCVVGC